MDQKKLHQMLNLLATRSLLQECQIMALRGILGQHNVVTDAEFDVAMKLAIETYKELLGGRKTDAEKLEDFLQRFEGPIQ